MHKCRGRREVYTWKLLVAITEPCSNIVISEPMEIDEDDEQEQTADEADTSGRKTFILMQENT